MSGGKVMFSGIRTHPLLKLVCLAGLGAWIGLWYYAPQRWPLFEARPAPTLWFDEWVPFQPMWALIYQSVFITHTLAIWLPGDARAVRRYTGILAAVYALAAFAFWFYPTLSPRPGEVESFLYYWLVTAIDGERNALPSLHAAMGTMAALQLYGHFRAVRAATGWRVLIACWWIVFLYSTLATRQHRAFDLVAGVLLVCAVLTAFRQPPLRD